MHDYILISDAAKLNTANGGAPLSKRHIQLKVQRGEFKSKRLGPLLLVYKPDILSYERQRAVKRRIKK